MAEARAEEEEENLRRDTREQVVRRQPSSSGGRPDRRKPEHRHSQGPLSSIRAVIKRTSRSTSVLETPRDRERDRRRPEITILAAEPLPSTSWFPGAVGGIPPPPPPPAQIWGPTIAPALQPPPSYEEVIREKTQEQVLLPPAPSSPPVSRTTIATQTDPGPAPNPRERRSGRPPRPPPPCTIRSSDTDDLNITSSQSAVSSSETNSVTSNTHPLPVTHSSTHTQCSASLSEQHLSSLLTCGSQTHQWDQSLPAEELAPPPDASTHVPLERPRPRPRTRLGRQPANEVKVQTLVKLREDGLATLAARAAGGRTNPEGNQGPYLQELLEAFSSDDWGFPDPHSEDSQSESGEEDGEDMATLRARIQAFEQQVADGGCGDTAGVHTVTTEGSVATRPEPRPRPRLLGQPAKSIPPAIAPKPKNLPAAPKPSSRAFWEDGGAAGESRKPGTPEVCPVESHPETQTTAEPSSTRTTQSDLGSELKPSITAKPQNVTDPLPSGTPVPAPRPPPPKLTHSISAGSSPPNPRAPRRPPVAPRASLGASQQEKSSEEVGGEAVTQTAKGGSSRSTVKPAAPASPRRASAPNLAPKPTLVPPARPDPNPVPPKPTAVNPVAPTKPPGPPKPPTPAPAMRKGSIPQSKSETENPPNPASSDTSLPLRPPSVKLLPLRPPPIKAAPGRPPPPAINSSPSANQIAASTTPAGRSSPSHSSSSTPTANQMQTQRVAKKGPPLPPRPKPGHPLYSSYMKQEVLIVLDDPIPTPTEPQESDEGKNQSSVISPPQCLLDSDPQPEPVQDKESESKTVIEDLNQPDIQSILPAELKEQPDPPAVSGPRCVALFDYEGEEEGELTFSQGDVIALLELVGEEWGRGQIHGRAGIFPLNFTEVLEPLPEITSSSSVETSKLESTEPGETENSVTVKPSELETEEWVVALFDFSGQTAEDLSFHKGALIQVTEHIDADWRRGRLDGREGLYPAAFTQPCQAQPITGQQSAAKGTAKAVFDFTAENEDELTLKVGDIITQVESIDEQWIMGVVSGKRGIVPKNYISFLR